MSDAQGTFLWWTGFPAVAGIWPVGDIYSLTPKWSEWHAPQGITCSCKSEKYIVQNQCADYGMPWAVDITLTDLGADLKSAADDVPLTGYVRTESWLKKDWGWGIEYAFDAEPVLDDADVWTGVVHLSLPIELHSQLGVNVPWTFQVRVVLEGTVGDPTTQYVVRVLAGYFLVKP